jgi:hypothetical protein
MSTLRNSYYCKAATFVLLLVTNGRWSLSSSSMFKVSNSCRDRLSPFPVASRLKSIEQWYVFYFILFPRKGSKSIYENDDRCNWLRLKPIKFKLNALRYHVSREKSTSSTCLQQSSWNQRLWSNHLIFGTYLHEYPLSWCLYDSI